MTPSSQLAPKPPDSSGTLATAPCSVNRRTFSFRHRVDTCQRGRSPWFAGATADAPVVVASSRHAIVRVRGGWKPPPLTDAPRTKRSDRGAVSDFPPASRQRALTDHWISSNLGCGRGLHWPLRALWRFLRSVAPSIPPIPPRSSPALRSPLCLSLQRAPVRIMQLATSSFETREKSCRTNQRLANCLIFLTRWH